jgi:bifunctional DNA-binding transcriptional regulator/antitoxin component of YhaV-PrlF toxin-antitoxin module
MEMKRLTGVGKVTTGFRITIDQSIVKALGIKPGDYVVYEILGVGKSPVEAVKVVVAKEKKEDVE